MGSADVGWAGQGDDREKWLAFRDGYCRRLFVEMSPLYPLNSVMHHGIVHGRAFQGDKVGKSGANLKNTKPAPTSPTAPCSRNSISPYPSDLTKLSFFTGKQAQVHFRS
jgi:hypothetical protein